MLDEPAASTGREESPPAGRDREPRLREALTWLGLLAPGAALTPAAAVSYAPLPNEDEAGALLHLLLAQGLLEALPSRNVDGHKMPAYRLRPGLRAHAPAPAHAALLDRYRARTWGGAWHTLPADGTIHDSLVWHMEQAGHLDEMHALLAEETADGRSGWHDARECRGQVAGYMRDLERAWQQADLAFAAGGPEAGSALTRQCRYALMASSLNSLAPEIPPTLLCALLRDGLWSPAQALAAAGAIPDPGLRAEGLVCLAAEPEMPAGMLASLINAAMAIDDEQHRAHALLALARRLPPDHIVLALDGIGGLPGEEQRARSLVELTPCLPAAALEQALVAAIALQDPPCRAEAVIGIAAYLPGDLLPQALAAVLEIEDEAGRAAALIRLGPHLPEALCRRALAGTWRMRDAAARCEAQAGLAAHLPAYWREKALAAALDGLAQVHHARVALLLASMAPHLPASLQERAVGLAEMQPDSHSRLTALAALLPHLAPQYRESTADLALRSTLLIRSEAGRAEAIARLVPHLPAGRLDTALAMAQSLADGRARAAALVGIAPFLEGRLAGDALLAARTIQDERSCAMALASLAPLLDTGQQRQAILRVASLADEKARATALVGLAPALDPSLLPDALAEAQRIADERALAAVLAGLAPAFDEAGQLAILAAATGITDPAVRLDALIGLLPPLSATQQAGAVEAGWRAIQAFDDEQAQMGALARLLACVADVAPDRGLGQEESASAVRLTAVLSEPLAAVAAIEDPARRCQALLALAPHLPARLREEAWAALSQEGQVAAADLLALIPHLPAQLQGPAAGQALAAARRLPGAGRRQIVGALVPYLDRMQLGKALAAVREISDGDEQAQVLVALAPALEEAGRREVLAAVGQVPEAWKRAALLARLLVQVGLKDDGQAQEAARLLEAVPETLLSARRSEDCWAGALALTSLARSAGDEEQAAILQDACRAARDIDDACCRAQALGRLVSQLPAERRQEVAREVLETVAGCPAGSNARLLGRVLAGIIPYLPAELLPAALHEARRLALPWTWSRHPEGNALAALVRRLPEESVRAELAAAGSIGDLHLRAQTLSALALRLAELGYSEEALSATRPIEPLPYQVDALLHLAPRLSLACLREALSMACDLGRHGAPAAARLAVRLAELGEVEEGWRAAAEIPGKRWQAEALAGVAPHLPAGCRTAACYQILEVAGTVDDAAERLGVLARLVSHLSGKPQLAALRAALGTAVAVKEADSGRRLRSGHRPWATPLAALAAPLATLAAAPGSSSMDATLHEIWLADGQGERLLHLLGRQPRPLTLLELAILAPLLTRLAGPAAALELLRAVQQVARWWP